MTSKLTKSPKKWKYLIYLGILAAYGIVGVYSALHPEFEAPNMDKIDTGDTSWILTASGLVLLMTPGLSFFYGGMVGRKNVISTMLQSMVALGIVNILWVIVGFSLAFGDSIYGIIGNPFTFFLFENVHLGVNPDFAPTIPFALFALFQMKFAIITPALISGGFAERIKFSSYLLFMSLFVLFIYAPLAHATWHPNGFLRQWGVLDFAGGTVVHISAGLAALAGSIFLGPRKNKHHEVAHIPYVILGTGLLWFGWFGFNAGSSLGANSTAAMAFMNTSLASAVAMMTWIFFDAFLGRKVSSLGACIGAVVGLVAITPAAGFVSVGSSIIIGIISSIVSNIAVSYRAKSRLDDTLDVFPCHGLGGIVGMILTAVFAKDVGVIYGESKTFFIHLLALVIVSLYCFGASYFLYFICNKIKPIRVSAEEEQMGLDLSQHGESI